MAEFPRRRVGGDHENRLVEEWKRQWHERWMADEPWLVSCRAASWVVDEQGVVEVVRARTGSLVDYCGERKCEYQDPWCIRLLVIARGGNHCLTPEMECGRRLARRVGLPANASDEER